MRFLRMVIGSRGACIDRNSTSRIERVLGKDTLDYCGYLELGETRIALSLLHYFRGKAIRAQSESRPQLEMHTHIVLDCR
jgi:hypothetical protein